MLIRKIETVSIAIISSPEIYKVTHLIRKNIFPQNTSKIYPLKFYLGKINQDFICPLIFYSKEVPREHCRALPSIKVTKLVAK